MCFSETLRGNLRVTKFFLKALQLITIRKLRL
jgi:hypothetical protein